MRYRRRSLKTESRTDILVRRKGYFTMRELGEYLGGLNKTTILKYMGKYGFEKAKGFPVRESINQEWYVRIYDVDVWLGRIKKGDEILEIEMIRKEKLVGVEKAEESLEYGYEYIRSLCRKKVLPAYKTRRKWLFLPSELEQWNIEQGR